jgi:hypothetical protein
MFFSVSPLLSVSEKRRPKNDLLQAAFRYMILQDHRRLPVCIFRVKIAAVGSLKRVTGRNFEISQEFHGRQAGENFFSTTRKQTILKSISEYFEIYIHRPAKN